MIDIRYRATGFGAHWGPSLSGNQLLTVTWPELVWAAVTVGKPGVAHLLTHSWHSVSDLLVRAHTVYANLQQTGWATSVVEKSTLYEAMDPTEKGAASYFVGMMAAKIVGARLLHTPWLFHLSMFRAMGGSAGLNGRSEPDLVGLNTHGDWIVAEAKGRTHGFSADAMSKAKAQTRRLRRINGNYPTLRVAIQAYFAPELQFAVVDPDTFDDDADDLDFEFANAMSKYYSSAYSLTQGSTESRILGGREFLIQRIEEVGVTIGLDRSRRDYLDKNENSEFLAGSFLRPNVSALNAEGDFTVFPDGIAIALDERWSDERMRSAPERRQDG